VIAFFPSAAIQPRGQTSGSGVPMQLREFSIYPRVLDAMPPVAP